VQLIYSLSWSGDRLLEEARSDPRRYERLLQQVAIVTDERPDVLKVPTAALRFRPPVARDDDGQAIRREQIRREVGEHIRVAAVEEPRDRWARIGACRRSALAARRIGGKASCVHAG